MDYSENPHTLGQHLKKRRIERGLLQCDAAALMGVSVDTYGGWERGRIRPYAGSWRVVIDFLGYDPHQPPETIGEQLKAKRRALGWSQARLAAHLGWDETTVYRYERGDRKPRGECLAQLTSFLGGGLVAPIVDPRTDT
jgi:transcriptional regulator with XRE-family HTH domain